jgi:outer membrane immunogenic protein
LQAFLFIVESIDFGERRMNRTLLAIVACAMVLSPSCLLAADMPIVKAPTPVATWTGFYAGVGVGIRSSVIKEQTTSVLETDTTVNPHVTTVDACANGGQCFFSLPLNDTGFRFSFYGGFNWQVDPSVVIGIEGDGGWARKVTTIFGTPAPGGPFLASGFITDNVSVNPVWDASVRLRGGYLITPTFLLYATGGAAWMNFSSTLTCGPPNIGDCELPVLPFTVTNHKTALGWTAGGGIETKISPHVLIRGEYRYADFGVVHFTTAPIVGTGTLTVFNYDVHPRTHTAVFGIAYQFWDFR